ncbi:MAG: hypothetical protein FWD68_04165 [Alphaproteobacteria bacterium]|nr:hypothetical protein [Alphaproteobacteria bacterium]
MADAAGIAVAPYGGDSTAVEQTIRRNHLKSVVHYLFLVRNMFLHFQPQKAEFLSWNLRLIANMFRTGTFFCRSDNPRTAIFGPALHTPGGNPQPASLHSCNPTSCSNGEQPASHAPGEKWLPQISA